MAWGGGTRLGLPRAQRKAVVKQSAEPRGEAVLDTRTRTFLLVTAQKGPSFWQGRDPRGVARALGQATLRPRRKLSQIWGKTPWLTQPHRLTALGSPSPHPAGSPTKGLQEALEKEIFPPDQCHNRFPQPPQPGTARICTRPASVPARAQRGTEQGSCRLLT